MSDKPGGREREPQPTTASPPAQTTANAPPGATSVPPQAAGDAAPPTVTNVPPQAPRPEPSPPQWGTPPPPGSPPAHPVTPAGWAARTYGQGHASQRQSSGHWLEHPRPARLCLGIAGTSLFTFVWLWLPWITVMLPSPADNDTVSTDGFHTIPGSCFVICSSPSTSPCAILLVIASVLAALCAIAWLLFGEPLLCQVLVGLSIATLVLAVANGFVLYLETSKIVQNDGDLSVYPSTGPFAATITAAITVVCALRARAALRPTQVTASPPLGLGQQRTF
jgi:hypothetical protein